jgi:ABC-type multidrug transport system fused ATPase/permease subunit
MRILLRTVSHLRHNWVAVLALLGATLVLPPIAVSIPLVEKQFIDSVVLPGNLDGLVGTVALYAVLWSLSFFIGTSASILRTFVCERLGNQLRERVFVHAEVLSVAFAQNEHSARTLALFSNDVPAMVGLPVSLLDAMSSLVALAVAAVLMFSLSWQLALVAVVLPPLVAFAAVVLTRPLRPAARLVQDKAAEVGQQLQEGLTGLREVVAFGLEERQRIRLQHDLSELLRLRMRLTVLDTTIRSGQSFVSLVVSVSLLGLGGYLVLQGQTTLGTIIAMRSLFSYVFQPAGQLAGVMASIQRALGAADRVYAFLDQAPQVRERPGASAPQRIRGEVIFADVSFAYRPDQPVLRDVSFVARPGELIALVGPSGAGKTTLAGLIARFYDPTHGEILFDGQDLRDLPVHALRNQIGMVFQNSFLFACSIRDNVAMGLPGAAEAQIVASLRDANAHEFVMQLPEGLDTQVGERGMRLSEGQKQRLAIARALLRNPRVLILDEPTSALDARSEQALQSALDSLMRGRTTFVIAHRLATIRRADRIFVLDQGRVVETGTHAELLERGGLFSELYRFQFAAPPPRLEPALT